MSSVVQEMSQLFSSNKNKSISDLARLSGDYIFIILKAVRANSLFI